MEILHFIVYPPDTLDAVYEEHEWRIDLLAATLQALGVPEPDVNALSELGWSYSADRVARERIQHGWPVHHRDVLHRVFAAYKDINGDVWQSERNLVRALEKMGVKMSVALSLLESANSIDVLTDRLALELEKQGHKAGFLTAKQAWYQG